MPRPTTLPEPWRSLALRLGGVQALADALHASARSVHHWAHGTRKPSRQAQAMIDQAMDGSRNIL
jgi:DNA-binding transcriptional regulator YdaS (Cro superfamily)